MVERNVCGSIGDHAPPPLGVHPDLSAFFAVQSPMTSVIVGGSVAIEGGHDSGEGVVDVGGNERLFG